MRTKWKQERTPSCCVLQQLGVHGVFRDLHIAHHTASNEDVLDRRLATTEASSALRSHS